MAKGLLWFLLLTLLASTLMWAKMAEASVPVSKVKNSLGVVIERKNPYMYMVGSVRSGAVVGTETKQFTSVLFQPYKTPLLFTDSVFFCHNVAPFFNGKSGILIVTYERQSHYMYQEIGCHNLVNVQEITFKDLQNVK